MVDFSMKANTYDGPDKSYYMCQITENLDQVSTNTTGNQRSDADFKLVWYSSGETVKYIPRSTFTTLPNVEYLFINSDNKMEVFKAEFLQGAKKLKNLHVKRNLVKELAGNLFVEAKNLEHINFEENQIQSIHKLAFNGLNNLQGIYLQFNRIYNLASTTFSFLSRLRILDLTGNICVNQKFPSASQRIVRIEAEIGGFCRYKLFPDEVAAQKLKEEAAKKAELERISRDAIHTISELVGKLLDAKEQNQRLSKIIQAGKENLVKIEGDLKESFVTIARLSLQVEDLKAKERTCLQVNTIEALRESLI